LGGAPVGQQGAGAYGEASVFYAYTGCRPSFVAGMRRTPYWARKEYPKLGPAVFQQLDGELLAADAAVDAICPTGRQRHDMDAVCSYAVAHAKCAPEGSDFVRCPLTPADRHVILGAAAGR